MQQCRISKIYQGPTPNHCFKGRGSGPEGIGEGGKGKGAGELYVAYRMASMLMTLYDFEGDFCCLKPF